MGYFYESNLDSDAGPWLVRTAAGFGLDAPAAAGGGTAGDRLAHALARRIHDRGMAFVGTAGNWPMNAESTARRKGFNAPNFRTGEMLDEGHVAGVVTSTHTETRIDYGTGSAGDRGVTDRERARFAEEGQSAQKIVRSFFGIIPEDADALVGIAAEEHEAHARKP